MLRRAGVAVVAAIGLLVAPAAIADEPTAANQANDGKSHFVDLYSKCSLKHGDGRLNCVSAIAGSTGLAAVAGTGGLMICLAAGRCREVPLDIVLEELTQSADRDSQEFKPRWQGKVHKAFERLNGWLAGQLEWAYKDYNWLDLIQASHPKVAKWIAENGQRLLATKGANWKESPLLSERTAAEAAVINYFGNGVLGHRTTAIIRQLEANARSPLPLHVQNLYDRQNFNVGDALNKYMELLDSVDPNRPAGATRPIATQTHLGVSRARLNDTPDHHDY